MTKWQYYSKYFLNFLHSIVISMQKQKVEQILETMEQLKKSDNLQRVASRYKRRAATFYAGELSRCDMCGYVGIYTGSTGGAKFYA